MQRMHRNQSGPTNVEVNMTPTHGVQDVQEVSNVGGMGNVGSISAPLQRTFIWSGTLEWIQIGKTSADQPCQVSAISNDIELELKVDTWPRKLLMPLIPKQLIRSIGRQYLKDMKRVQFHLQQNEKLDALTKALVGGFAGCVCLYSMSPQLPQFDKRVILLLYDIDSKTYQGFIPNNQSTFVEQLRKAIRQKISKQLPVSGGETLPASHVGGGMQPGMSSMSGQQPQQHPQGMMMGVGMGGQVDQVGQVGQVGQVAQVQGGKARCVPLDGLEAARQQNLEKIQHLQQTLEAAHQQEAQFKSQIDIMAHLNVAQQQEQCYKQLEEQQKHQLQLQQQKQLLQLRGASPRLLHSHLPANPILRHLLQQEAHFKHQPRALRRACCARTCPSTPTSNFCCSQRGTARARGTPPGAQTQQFDEASKYDSIK